MNVEADNIAREVEEKFKEVQKKKVTRGGRSNNVHVSHLTQPCIRRSWYDFHEDPSPLTYDSICNFFAGTILHENAPLSKRNEVPVGANVRTMKPIKAKEINDINKYDCVTGTVDDIIEREGDIIIIDKKTFNGKKKLTEPSEDYVNQINIYKLLLKVNESIEAKYGCILYLDKSKSFKDPLAFVFELRPIEHIRLDIIKKLDYLKMTVEPERTVSWRCNWCPHKEVCNPPMDMTGKWS